MSVHRSAFGVWRSAFKVQEAFAVPYSTPQRESVTGPEVSHATMKNKKSFDLLTAAMGGRAYDQTPPNAER
jgi:hypothetical protein